MKLVLSNIDPCKFFVVDNSKIAQYTMQKLKRKIKIRRDTIDFYVSEARERKEEVFALVNGRLESDEFYFDIKLSYGTLFIKCRNYLYSFIF